MKPENPPPTTWTLVNELGFEGIPDPAQGIDLRYPAYAAKAEDGTYLIGDEYGTEKLVPFRFESRMIRVDKQGQPTFDSFPLGIDDGFGCLMNNGLAAILHRTKWELIVVSPQGEIVDRLALSSMSKRMPRYVTWTDRGTFVLVFCNRVGEVEIVEMDRQGKLLWFHAPSASEIGIAGSVQWLRTDTFLIADPFRHVVVEIDRGGNVVWQFGEAGAPSRALHHVSSPGSARLMSDGRRLIADTRNHRILLVTPQGTPEPLELAEGQLCDPAYATELDNGNFLICDTGNRRVVEVDSEGRVVWQFGSVAPQRRHFSYPRSVELLGSGDFLVADTANDRVVDLTNGQVRERAIEATPPLFWPRCARPLPAGGLLIADGRNGRIVEIAAEGHVVNELAEIDLEGYTKLSDPHDVRMLSNGQLLIADSAQDLVVLADWSGRVHKAIGVEGTVRLRDPHSAQQLDDGSVVIADTGNHRILVVGPDGTCVRQIHAIDAGSSFYRLNFPRHVEITEDGTMVIADTGHNRVLAATSDGRFLWEFSEVPGSQLARLNQPRWAKPINPNEVLVCDHFHHRILHVQRQQKPVP